MTFWRKYDDMCAPLTHPQIKYDGFPKAYDLQNDHIWAINHQGADKKVAMKKKISISNKRDSLVGYVQCRVNKACYFGQRDIKS